MADARYVPALRFRALTGAYDPLIRWTTREARFRPALLSQAALKSEHRILDLGCGTGTLVRMAKEHVPGIEAVGVDADPGILELARQKTARRAVEARFDQALSYDLPYEDRSFDRVLSSLVFHHLTTEEKRRTIAEVARVLKPGGELHVADWGRPSDPLMYTLGWPLRLFDGLERTKANLEGRLPELFEAGELVDATETDRLRTLFGTLALYRARRPSPDAVKVDSGQPKRRSRSSPG